MATVSMELSVDDRTDKSSPGLIAVLAGGPSAEREVSMDSGKEVVANLNRSQSDLQAVLVEIPKELQQPWLVHFGQEPEESLILNKVDFSFPSPKGKEQIEAVFIAVHGSPGEDGKLAAYLEMLGIPHTTCDTAAGAITFNKDVCKQLIRESRAHLALSRMLSRSEWETAKQEGAKTAYSTELGLQFPVFVKPNQNGSSCGISLVRDERNLAAALEEGFKFDSALLIEEEIKGTEVTCGLYRKEGAVVTLPLTEIVAGEEHNFFNYEAKYHSQTTQEITPARISQSLTAKCEEISREIYEMLNLKGLVRIDYILKGEDFYFLEVNTVPGMSAASIVPKMVREAGMDLADFYATLVEECVLEAI